MWLYTEALIGPSHTPVSVRCLRSFVTRSENINPPVPRVLLKSRLQISLSSCGLLLPHPALVYTHTAPPAHWSPSAGVCVHPQRISGPAALPLPDTHTHTLMTDEVLQHLCDYKLVCVVKTEFRHFPFTRSETEGKVLVYIHWVCVCTVAAVEL